MFLCLAWSKPCLILWLLNVVMALSDKEDKVERARSDQYVSHVWKGLIHNNDRLMRPNYTGSPITIYVDMTVLSFGSINEREMSFGVDLSLRQSWRDERLSHELNEPIIPLLGHKGPADLIWVPDSVFINALKSTQHKATVNNDKLVIHKEGYVFWSTRISVLASCFLNLLHYPLDKQTCHIGLVSYAYPIDHVIYKWNGKNACVIYNQQMSQYTLTQHQIDERIAVYTLGNYSILDAEFTFKRRVAVSIIQIFFPTISVVCVSWVALWVHKRCTSARVGLGVTSLLTLCTIWGSVNIRLPEVSYVKAVDLYFMVSLCFVLLTLLEYTIVLNVEFNYHKKKKRKKRKKTRVDGKDEKQSKRITAETRLMQDGITISKLEPQKKNSVVMCTKRKESVTTSLYEQRKLPDIFEVTTIDDVRDVTYELQDNMRKMESIKEKIEEEKTPPLDKVSRIILPLGFLVFNLCFWIKFSSDC